MRNLVIDVSARDAAERIIAAVLQAFGSIDILVNNAGILRRGGVDTVTDEDWDQTMAINVTAILRLTRSASVPMKAAGYGRIVNMGSINSTFGTAGVAAYVVSKHAVAGITRAAAADLGPYGITANFLAPGMIATEMTKGVTADSKRAETFLRKVPAGIFGEPSDIANAALFLASEEARLINGTGLTLDGGTMSHTGYEALT